MRECESRSLQLVLSSPRSLLCVGLRRVANSRCRDLEDVLALLRLDDREQRVRRAADEVDLRELGQLSSSNPEAVAHLCASCRTVPAPLAFRVELLHVVVVRTLRRLGRPALEVAKTRPRAVVVRLLCPLAKEAEAVGVSAGGQRVSEEGYGGVAGRLTRPHPSRCMSHRASATPSRVPSPSRAAS